MCAYVNMYVCACACVYICVGGMTGCSSVSLIEYIFLSLNLCISSL